ncbi:resolvase-like protein [Sphingomonas sp. PP-CE-1A-559]|uniref:recombinase family protein n=1 Tax=Sphingomonas sp. PP-CE-1A-559 TaxID=2135657 RepID=UPI0010D7C70E|nr:recombinase family protein [Sphingomonas sp. PP-CE-1A-559]TCP92761.1 resolvase-like protein [Sphingomonas sp. PP-CE-1A-559]
MNFVAYYRVSTAKQGASGLGLEAQQCAVLRYLAGVEPIASYTEVESGKRNDRQQLQAALAYSKLTGATLVVAKLDRLSRNAAFLNTLMDSGQSVVFADMPHADRLTVGMMAQLAQWEREVISKRTKEALTAARARGRILGGDRGNLPAVSAVGRQRSMAVRGARAVDRRAALMPHVEAARVAGASTLQAIADHLNALHITTARGGTWYPASIARLLK